MNIKICEKCLGYKISRVIWYPFAKEHGNLNLYCQQEDVNLSGYTCTIDTIYTGKFPINLYDTKETLENMEILTKGYKHTGFVPIFENNCLHVLEHLLYDWNKK